MKLVRFFILLLLLLGLAAVYYFYFVKKNHTEISTPTSTSIVPPANDPATISQPASTFAEPVADFKTRVTKKPFGIQITPQNSPVQPERFSGYHTGIDIEYQDITSDVPVYAIASGTIVLSQTASGYGGVFMIQIEIDGIAHNVLYGHIRPSSLPKVGQKFNRGEQIALLGTGYSSETSGERRHLHLAVLSDTQVDIKGYVSTPSALSGWLDPLKFF